MISRYGKSHTLPVAVSQSLSVSPLYEEPAGIAVIRRLGYTLLPHILNGGTLLLHVPKKSRKAFPCPLCCTCPPAAGCRGRAGAMSLRKRPNGSAPRNPVRRIIYLSNAHAVFCTASVFLIPLQFLVQCRSCRRAGCTTARREPPSLPSQIPLPGR